MPMTTRRLAVASTQLRDERLAGRMQQDRLQRAREVVLQKAEDNNNNCMYGIVYSPELLREMLLGHTDEHGILSPADRVHVRTHYDRREAWKMVTSFRAAFNSLALLQSAALVERGCSWEQVEERNASPPGFNLWKMLFQFSLDPPYTQASADKELARLNWSDNANYSLWKLRQRLDFELCAQHYTPAVLVASGCLPVHEQDNVELAEAARLAIAACASVRMMRDGISVQDAFLAVVLSQGLQAAFFG